MPVCVRLSADTPAAAAAGDAETSRTMTRCSCDVGCPCCGRCIETSSVSSSSWPPLPASSVAALRDVDVFIATYRVSPPPPLIQSPPALSSDSTTWMLPALTTAQLESSASTLSCRNALLEDYGELRGTLADTAAKLVDYQPNVGIRGTLQQQNNESVSQTNWNWNSNGSALDFTTRSVFSNINPDAQVYNDAIPAVTAAGVYNDASLEQPSSYSLSSQDMYSHPAVPCVSTVYSWNIDGQPLDEPGSTLAFDVGSNSINSFSTNVNESGLQPTDRAVYNSSTEVGGKVADSVSTDPPRSSVITLAQQLDKYWAQRGDVAGGIQSTIQHDKAPVVRELSRPTAPPPAPPGSLASTNAYVDRPVADQLMIQTLPRAASTRSLQAPPPRPPPRSTTHESNNTSALLGRSLPPEPDLQTTFDRISLCQGQMTTFQSPRTLRESGSYGGLSGSVQSLPGCDVTASSLVAGSTTSRGRPAPQPPRRGSSMSPRLQAKCTRHGHRARSASLRSSDDDGDSDVLLRLGNSSALTSATLTRQQLDASGTNQSTVNVAERETARKATVSGGKPVAQIRPHAIRSPSASSYTRQRIDDDGDNKCSTEARTSVVQQSSVQTRATDDCSDSQSFSFTSVGVSTDRQGGTASNVSFSRFGTLRSRIKDYVTAAASVGANRKQQTTSSSFADWTLPRGRRPGVARRSSSATSWEPDRSDYASSGSEQSRGTAALDDSAVWSSSSYFGVFPGPRPFSSPRTRATEVSLPQNIIASADSAMSAADVTSSITSRISTFLTFLGGSRRPQSSSPTSDTPPSTLSATPPQPGSTTVSSSTGIERPRNSASYTRIPTAKAVVDPVVSTLERQSRAVSSSPPVRSASTSEVLAKAAAAAAAAARDARGRQPMRFVREQRTSMSTFRSSGSLVVSVARSSSFSPHSTSAAREAHQSADGSQVSDGRRTSKSGILDDGDGQVSSPAQLPTKHPPSVARYAHQSAPSTPLDWNDEDRTQQTMTSSLPFDNSVVQPPQMDHTANSGDSPATTKEAHEVPQSSYSSTVPLSVFRQVDVEVERLIELLQNAAVADDPPPWRDADGSGKQVEAARESLLALTRQFVDDSQRLVSGATRSVDALVAGVEPSLDTLTRLTGECQSTAALLASPSQGVMLVGRVRDLAQAYRSTVSAARSAVGRPFNSVEMKSLMRQATSLAAILSSLIKMLNRTDIIC